MRAGVWYTLFQTRMLYPAANFKSRYIRDKSALDVAANEEIKKLLTGSI